MAGVPLKTNGKVVHVETHPAAVSGDMEVLDVILGGQTTNDLPKEGPGCVGRFLP